MQNPDEIANIGDDLPEWFLRAMDVPREDLEMKIGNANIRYFHWGKAHNQPVILIHGLLSHRRCWAFVAPLLAENYNIFAMDLSGMGDSSHSNNYTLEKRIDEIKDFAEGLNLKEKPFLVGHSFGGGLLVHLAEKFPHLARAILACDTLMLRPEDVQGFIDGRNQRSSFSPGKRKKKIYPDWETIYSRFRLSPEQPVGCPFLFEYMAKHSVKKIDEGWTWKFDPQIINQDGGGSFWWSENTEKFCEIEMPKAIIYGKKSQLFSAEMQGYLTKHSKTAFPLVGIPKAHHHVMLDQPLTLANEIEKIFANWKDCK